jgi:hypothetical protein
VRNTLGMDMFNSTSLPIPSSSSRPNSGNFGGLVGLTDMIMGHNSGSRSNSGPPSRTSSRPNSGNLTGNPNLHLMMSQSGVPQQSLPPAVGWHSPTDYDNEKMQISPRLSNDDLMAVSSPPHDLS